MTEFIELLKQIFMILFVGTGIVAVLYLLYAIIVAAVKSIRYELNGKKRAEEEAQKRAQAEKDFDEFCKFLVTELEKEDKTAKKVSKTKKSK